MGISFQSTQFAQLIKIVTDRSKAVRMLQFFFVRRGFIYGVSS